MFTITPMNEIQIHAPDLFKEGTFGVFSVSSDEMQNFLNVWLRHPSSVTQIIIKMPEAQKITQEIR